jgi:riboflavin synthase
VFTGLIADLGEVTALQRDSAGARLRISTPLAAELGEGDSIAVSGVCLTAAAVGEEFFEAQVMAQTLERSTLGALSAGAPVNLELPLHADGRLGGHVVQGHVDGTGTVAGVQEQGFARVLSVQADRALLRYLAPRGSVALDGVSLTVAELQPDRFTVSLVPETLARTTLGRAAVGDPVNLEVDILAKHVERLLAAPE